MVKSASLFLDVQNDSHQIITQELAQHHPCYVLITCGDPTPDGQMKVEMTYAGDPILAAYLVESASTIMDGDVS